MANALERRLDRPRIKRTIEIIEAPCGDLHLMRATAADVRIPQPTDEDRDLLAALQEGRSSVVQLATEFDPGLVAETVAEMSRLGLLEDAADYERLEDDDLVRFDRQLRYFSDLAVDDLRPADCQERLQEAVVVILGVGGLGGRVALELACIGVGHLFLVDGDEVEVSNLNRQIQFGEVDVGRPKAECMAERITAFNSSIEVNALCTRIDSESDLAKRIEGADIVIDAADWPPHEIEHWCNSACFASGIPYIAMSHFPPIARVGPLYVPGKTGCYECQIRQYRQEYPLFDVAIDQRRGLKSPAATLGPACGLAGGLVAVEVLHYLTGLAAPATLGVGFTYDLRDLSTERETVHPDPACPVCRGSVNP
jgi:molybdopterin-synthase adenylyltransferase